METTAKTSKQGEDMGLEVFSLQMETTDIPMDIPIETNTFSMEVHNQPCWHAGVTYSQEGHFRSCTVKIEILVVLGDSQMETT